VARLAPAALVAALLVASAAAFAYTERLKLTRSPILGTRVDKLFSPVCECESDVARIAFRLRKRDRVTVAIIDRSGGVVRTILSQAAEQRGPVSLSWNGRNDAGVVVPDGVYKPRVKLALNRRTIVLPNPIQVDTRAPRVDLVSARPRVFSPDGDGRSDRVVLTYRVDEPAHVSLYVNGRQRVVKKGSRTGGTIDWYGKVRGVSLPPGRYSLSLAALDRAGNLGHRTRPVRVILRYVALSRSRIVVAAGGVLTLFVSTDANRVDWHLFGRSGTVAPGTIHLRAPRRPGRYTLTIGEHGHAARSVVVVRARG
jgi:hypothetical protein